MKRVLIITYYWPPSGGAGVQRWLKFAKYLPEFGWEPVIYTPENPEAPIDDPSLFKDIHPQTKVIKRPIWEPYQLYKKFLGMRSEERINAGFLTEKEKPGKRELWSRWIRGNMFIPDARKFWIKPSVKFLSTFLKQHPVDAIITTGPPHSMHLIALKISKKIDLPWLADFRDPWTSIDFYDQLQLSKWSDNKHHKLEKKVLTSSNRVVVIGKSMGEDFTRLAGIKPVVIPNGYDEDDFKEINTSPGTDFTIVHIGAMNKDRNHDAFWESVAKIIHEKKSGPDVKIKLIGKVDVSVLHSIKNYKITEMTELIPYLAHDLVISEMKSASLLYLPINNTSNAKAIQTGKIFEYIASGRPILGIGPIDGDAAEILHTAEVGTMIDFTDKEKIHSTILSFLEAFISGKKYSSNVHSQYSRQILAKSIAESLNEIIG